MNSNVLYAWYFYQVDETQDVGFSDFELHY